MGEVGLQLDDTRYDALRGTRVVVTGGAGFIGSHLSAALLGLGCSVVVLDDLSSGHARNVQPGAELVRASVTDPDAVAEAVRGADTVFHEAAMVSVPESVANPARCAEVNLVGTQAVLSACAAAGVRRVLFAASAAAYGNEPTLPSSEADAPDAWSPYAASKIAGEQLLKSAARTTGLSTVSLRYFNVFGPRQDPKSAYAAAISAFADRLTGGRGVTIFGDGAQTRDFVYIDNVVHANLLAAASARDLQGDVFNIGTGDSISLLDVVASMQRALGTSLAVEHAEPRAGDVRHSRADIDSARSLLGYEAIVGLDEGLARTLRGWG